MELFLRLPVAGQRAELQNVIERAAILTEARHRFEVEENSLARRLEGTPAAAFASLEPPGEEKKMIEVRARRNPGTGLRSRRTRDPPPDPSTTLESKIRKLNIDKHRFRLAPVSRGER